MDYYGCSRSIKTAKRRCTEAAWEHGNAFVVPHPKYIDSWVILSTTDPRERPEVCVRYESHHKIETTEEEIT